MKISSSSRTALLLLLLLPFPGKAQSFEGKFTIYEKDGKYGLLRDNGDVQLKAKYDTIVAASPETFLYREDGLYGLYCKSRDRYGNEKRTRFWSEGKSYFQYERNKPLYTAYHGSFSDDDFGWFYLADETGNYGTFYNSNGTQRPGGFTYTEIIERKNFDFCRESKWQWAVLREDGVKTVYGDSLVIFDHNIFFLNHQDDDGSFDVMTLIESNGELQYGLEYHPDFGKRTIIVKGDDLSILMNSSGDFISQWSYDIDSLSPDFYRVQRPAENGTSIQRYGVVDTNGRQVINDNYASVSFDGKCFQTYRTYTEGWLFEKTNTEYTLFDSEGISLCSHHSEIIPFGENAYIVGGKVFDMTLRGYDTTIHYVRQNSDGIYQVQYDQGYCYVSRDGKVKSQEFPVEYHYIVNRSGADMFFGFFKMITVLPFALDLATGNDPFGGNYTLEKSYGEGFSDGLARVAMGNDKGQPRYGFINTSFELVIPCVYTDAGYFHDEIAFVCKETDGFAIVDRNNQLRTAYIYSTYDFFGDSLIIVQSLKSTDYFVIDYFGKRITGLPLIWSYSYTGNGAVEIEVLKAGVIKEYYLYTDGTMTPKPN